MARVLLIEPFSGAAGDMFLGALVGLGVSLDELRQGLGTLPLEGFALEAESVQRASLAATKARVLLKALDGVEEPRGSGHQSNPSGHGRTPAEIEGIIGRSGLPAPVKDFACRTFALLGEAEARVHGTTPDKVHFHEVGAVDAIVDICGAALGFHLLGIEAAWCRPVATGHGTVQTAHGTLPVPVPASLELLRGMPLAPTDIAAELVTPTGAAILRALNPTFGSWPVVRVLASACGAGSDDRDQRANVLRLSLAETGLEPAQSSVLGIYSVLESDSVLEIDFEVDDMTPEELGVLRERIPPELLLDLTFTPCQMKKGRPGQRVTLLLREDALQAAEEIIFRHTTTFGFRTTVRERRILRREMITVETPFGPCPVKIGIYQGEIISVHPEADVVRELAQKAGASFREVATSATALAGERWSGPSGGS